MYLSHNSLDRDDEVSCRELNIMVDLARNLEGVCGAAGGALEVRCEE